MVIENVADQRQISESRAAHACLLLLIEQHELLFMAPADMLARCKFNYFEESVPVRILLIVLIIPKLNLPLSLTAFFLMSGGTGGVGSRL